MRKYKHMGDKEFSSLKALQSAGTAAGLVSKVTGRSQGTILNVYAADSLKTYKEIIRGASKVKNNKHTGNNDMPAIDEKLIIPAGADSTNDIVNQLEQINKTLLRLAEAWEAQPYKKRIPFF